MSFSPYNPLNVSKPNLPSLPLQICKYIIVANYIILTITQIILKVSFQIRYFHGYVFANIAHHLWRDSNIFNPRQI